AHLPDAAFARPSGCRGWLVQDLVCHLVIDAQDVLITLATPADGGAGGVGVDGGGGVGVGGGGGVEAAPVKDAVTYWTVTTQPPSGQDPLDALTVRLAAAYQDPELLRFHLDDVGSAAGRAAVLADPAARVSTQGAVLTVADYLSAYVLEWALHHLDLVADLPGTVDVPGPSADTLAAARELLERIAGEPFPAAWPDADALLVGTGRRVPTDTERAQLGPLADRVPLVLS